MKIFNFIDVRWQDGFSAVSDAPNDVRLAIEKIVEGIPIASEHAHVSVQPAKLAAFPGATVGVLRFDSTVSIATRLHTYLHVLVVADGFEPLRLAAWEALIAGRYGDDVEAQIRALNERCATADKREGKAALVPFEFVLDDVAAVLDERGGRGAAAPPSGRVAVLALPAPASAPVASTRRGRPASTWIAAVGAIIAIVAVIAAVEARRTRGEAGGARGECADGAPARVAAAEAGRVAAEARVAGIAEEVERLRGKCVFADHNAEELAGEVERCAREVAQARGRMGSCDAALADCRPALEQARGQASALARDVVALRAVAAATERKFLQLGIAHEALGKQRTAELAAKQKALDDGRRQLDTKQRAIDAGTAKAARLTHALLNACGRCGPACQAICEEAL